MLLLERGIRFQRRFARSTPDKRACRSPRGECEPSFCFATQSKKVFISSLSLCQRKKHTERCASRWRRERDSNPRVFAHKLISRNTMGVTIRPSASLISKKITVFFAFLLPICQIFRKSDRKVIENMVWSSLNTIFSNQHFRLYIRQSVCL